MRIIYYFLFLSLLYTPTALFAQQNVGIGTTDPSEALEVVGNIELSGIIVTESFQTPTLLNNWVNYGSNYANAGYYKNKDGRVFIRGLIKSGNTNFGTILFTLPVGYRPSSSGRQIFPVISNDAIGRIDVDANGNVLFIQGSNSWLSLNGISFRAD